MSSHSYTLFWFRANQSFLFLLNDACLAEKQQPEQGEKLVPNTLMFVFFIYRIKSCSYLDLFSRTWWLLNIYKKNIVSQSNGKFDSVITWPLDIPVSSLMMFVILLFFLFIVFLPNLYREKGSRSIKSFTVSCLSVWLLVRSDISTCMASMFNLQLRI